MNQTIAGLQEAQAACLELLAAMQPTGALGAAVQLSLATAHRVATSATPVASGAWRASHRVRQSGLRGEVFLDPSARNPENGALVRIYAAANAERRGGRYDVYRTVEQQGAQIARAAAEGVVKELPQ